MLDVQHTPDRGMSKLSRIGQRYFKLIEFDENEEMLLEIRKHWFGLFILIFTAGFIAVAVMTATIFLASSDFLENIDFENARSLVALLGFIVTVLIAGAALIFGILYRSNVVYVTDEKIAQVLYITIFNRKISQLNIGDVQDVTVSQNGFFAHMFHYGTLVIETAGEQQNYTFTFVPSPHDVAKQIIVAHEANLKQYGN